MDLIPTHGGYRNLKSFQVAQVVYDLTVRFCDRYIEKRSRKESIMIKLLIIALVILSLPMLTLAQKSRQAFAYDYTIDDLPNGWGLVTGPNDYSHLVPPYMLVPSGSCNWRAEGQSIH